MGFLDSPREEGVLSLYPVCDVSCKISSCTGIEGGEREEKSEGKRERESREIVLGREEKVSLYFTYGF